MAIRTFGLIVALAILAVAVAEPKATKKPIVPTEIISVTADLIYDIYDAGYTAAEKVISPLGIHHHIKRHATTVFTDDPIHHTCKKIGCNKKDITDTLDKAHATVTQVKAQAYEHGAKAHEALNDLAGVAVTRFEAHVPSYKGVAPKKFWDLALIVLYFLFVTYVILRIVRVALSMSCKFFCCVCCCGCCRRKKAAAQTNGKTKAKANAGEKGAAAAKTAPKAKAKGGK